MKNLRMLSLLFCLALNADDDRRFEREFHTEAVLSPSLNKRKNPVSSFTNTIYERGIGVLKNKYSKETQEKRERVFFISFANTNSTPAYLDKLFAMTDEELSNHKIDELRYEIIRYVYKIRDKIDSRIRDFADYYIDATDREETEQIEVLKSIRYGVESGEYKRYGEAEWNKELLYLTSLTRCEKRDGVTEYYGLNYATKWILDPLDRVMNRYYSHDKWLSASYEKYTEKEEMFSRSFVQSARQGIQYGKGIFKIDNTKKAIKHTDKEAVWNAWKISAEEYKKIEIHYSEHKLGRMGSMHKFERNVGARGGSFQREYELSMEILRDAFDYFWEKGDPTTEDGRYEILEKVSTDIPPNYIEDKYENRYVTNLAEKIAAKRNNMNVAEYLKLTKYNSNDEITLKEQNKLRESSVIGREELDGMIDSMILVGHKDEGCLDKPISEAMRKSVDRIEDKHIEDMIYSHTFSIKTESRFKERVREKEEAEVAELCEDKGHAANLYAEAAKHSTEDPKIRKSLAQTIVLFEKAIGDIHNKRNSHLEDEIKKDAEEMEAGAKEIRSTFLKWKSSDAEETWAEINGYLIALLTGTIREDDHELLVKLQKELDKFSKEEFRELFRVDKYNHTFDNEEESNKIADYLYEVRGKIKNELGDKRGELQDKFDDLMEEWMKLYDGVREALGGVVIIDEVLCRQKGIKAPWRGRARDIAGDSLDEISKNIVGMMNHKLGKEKYEDVLGAIERVVRIRKEPGKKRQRIKEGLVERGKKAIEDVMNNDEKTMKLIDDKFQ